MTPIDKRPTPRTDAEAMRCSGNTDDDADGQAVVGIRFSRTLERENAMLREALEYWIADETWMDEHYPRTDPLCKKHWDKWYQHIAALAATDPERKT